MTMLRLPVFGVVFLIVPIWCTQEIPTQFHGRWQDLKKNPVTISNFNIAGLEDMDYNAVLKMVDEKGHLAYVWDNSNATKHIIMKADLQPSLASCPVIVRSDWRKVGWHKLYFSERLKDGYMAESDNTFNGGYQHSTMESCSVNTQLGFHWQMRLTSGNFDKTQLKYRKEQITTFECLASYTPVSGKGRFHVTRAHLKESWEDGKVVEEEEKLICFFDNNETPSSQLEQMSDCNINEYVPEKVFRVINFQREEKSTNSNPENMMLPFWVKPGKVWSGTEIDIDGVVQNATISFDVLNEYTIRFMVSGELAPMQRYFVTSTSFAESGKEFNFIVYQKARCTGKEPKNSADYHSNSYHRRNRYYDPGQSLEEVKPEEKDLKIEKLNAKTISLSGDVVLQGMFSLNCKGSASEASEVKAMELLKATFRDDEEIAAMDYEQVVARR